MKWFLNVIGLILIFAGTLFFLQGMRVLPSPVMYGKLEWVVIGAGMVIVGAVVIIIQRRARKSKQ